MATNLYDIHLDLALAGRKEVYQYLATELSKDSLIDQSVILEALVWREKLGSIEIAPGVVLPHVELPGLANRIIISRLASAINWSETVDRVQLVLTIALDSQARATEQFAIQAFVRKLADEYFVHQLRKVDLKHLEIMLENL